MRTDAALPTAELTLRLEQGDCMDHLPSVATGSVRAFICDPSYGIDFQSQRPLDKTNRRPKLANDDRPFIWWLREAYRATADGGCVLCFCRWDVQELFRQAIWAAGYNVKGQVIWDRDWHGSGDLAAQFAPQHDVIWFGVKGKFAFPGLRPNSVIRVRRLAPQHMVHPTEKPVELMAELICAVTRPGDIVCDPMMGSGSTGEAAIREGRGFIGYEIYPHHFITAQTRILEALSCRP